MSNRVEAISAKYRTDKKLSGGTRKEYKSQSETSLRHRLSFEVGNCSAFLAILSHICKRCARRIGRGGSDSAFTAEVGRLCSDVGRTTL